MKNFKSVTLFAILVALAGLSFGQTAMTTTTLSSSYTCTVQANGSIGCPGTLSVASATNILAPAPNNSNRTVLYIDDTAYFVKSVSGTSISVTGGVKGTNNRSHRSGQTVYVGPDNPNYFVAIAPKGSCTAANYPILPIIEVPTGKAWSCVGTPGRWGSLMAFRVPAADCTYAPTTLTTTNILTQIGASNLMVSQGTSNAAAGTLTMTCDIWVPSQVGLGQGAILNDITLFVGSQTTAPTSLGTSTLGSITFPAAATTEVASTVTPVAVGGTVTTTSPTLITTVTTAGSFLTIKHTYGSLVQLNTDLQVLQYTMPFVQSAGAAMVINTPGLLVHYWSDSVH